MWGRVEGTLNVLISPLSNITKSVKVPPISVLIGIVCLSTSPYNIAKVWFCHKERHDLRFKERQTKETASPERV